ncbi:6-bladed beta-propeller [Candidatus Palauibacter sp.]|uniref:6-bladed beta-propeller n=1 Tax=Candidatus Palauibacter sp. TaxID=3101350 RepID=UPI003C7057A5
MPPRTLTSLIIATSLAACDAGAGASGAGPDVVVETRGDTTVVRTLSGNVWGADATLVPQLSIGEVEGPEEFLFGAIGSIAVDDDGRVYVLDRQAFNVRGFDADGAHIETLGGPGEGPGELSTTGSIAILPGGRVAAQDPLNSRIQVYGPEPNETEAWRYESGAFVLPFKPLFVDPLGRILVAAPQSSAPGDVVEQVAVLGADGVQQDTLIPPHGDFEPPSVEVYVPMFERSVTSPVPLTARRHWTLNPDGHFVTGVSTDYRIDLEGDAGVLRIERVYEPVAVSEAERSYHREDTTRSMRLTQPDWSWNGPLIPETKPPFRGLISGRDGRIWVQLWTEAYPEENEDYDPDNPRSDPVTWPSPLRYDVFDSDGTYLGAVVPPEGFADYPQPIFDGDDVWAVTRDALGVERVVHFRLQVGGGNR